MNKVMHVHILKVMIILFCSSKTNKDHFIDSYVNVIFKGFTIKAAIMELKKIDFIDLISTVM